MTARKKYVKGAPPSREDPGHEHEVFHPKISSRAKKYKDPDGKDVHSRLYDHAHKTMIDKHNEQVIRIR